MHLRILDPLRIKPSSHAKDTLWGYTVRLPKDDPFDGDPIGPQSLAKTRRRKRNLQISDTNNFWVQNIKLELKVSRRSMIQAIQERVRLK